MMPGILERLLADDQDKALTLMAHPDHLDERPLERQTAEIRTLPQRERDAKNIASGIAEHFYEMRLDNGVFEPFITSFCDHNEKAYETENGLLSQWRAYGGSSGYALVFNDPQLRHLLINGNLPFYTHGCSFRDVVYEDDVQRLENNFPGLEKLLKQAGKNGGLNGIQLSPLYFALCAFKHRSFEEEKEIGFVAAPKREKHITLMERSDLLGTGALKIKQRCVRPDLAPYIILNSEEGRENLPIERIIVGPSSDQDIRRLRLRTYLQHLGLDIKVTCSQTPLIM
ncbi:MAG: DUF2971 domain-containing protein [Hyphomicrobiaceae bacterium]